jgi:hypothetical protein
MKIPLASINPALDEKIRATKPGMVHWAGTGPPGTTCCQCAAWMKPRGVELINASYPCAKWVAWQKRKTGSRIPAQTASCSYFAARTEKNDLLGVS